MLHGCSGHFGKRPVLPGGFGKPGRLLGIAIDFSKNRILATAVDSKRLLSSKTHEQPNSANQIAADWVEVVGSGVGIGKVQGCGLVPALIGGGGQFRMRINFGSDSSRPLRLAPPSEGFLPLALVAGEGSLWSKVSCGNAEIQK